MFVWGSRRRAGTRALLPSWVKNTQASSALCGQHSHGRDLHRDTTLVGASFISEPWKGVKGPASFARIGSEACGISFAEVPYCSFVLLAEFEIGNQIPQLRNKWGGGDYSPVHPRLITDGQPMDS